MGVNLWNSNVSTPTLALPLQGGELARGPNVFSNGLSGFKIDQDDWAICCIFATQRDFNTHLTKYPCIRDGLQYYGKQHEVESRK